MFDLVVDGKPLEKLIEVVHSVFGTLYEPRNRVRLAKAEVEAERIKAFGSAKTNALLANNIEQYDQLSLAERRVLVKEEKRQRNIENVLQVSAQTLKDEPVVSEEPVNPDWATRFFDIAQDISNEQMQDLWGRILAGEVKKPHSYSLRTLESLRNITREEAELFERAAQYVLYDGSYYLYHFSDASEEDVPIEYSEIARLVEIGLIQAGSSVSQNYYNDKEESRIAYLFYASKYVALIEVTPSMKKVSFPIYSLTKTGEELYHLIQLTPDIGYFESVLRKISLANKKCSIKYAILNRLDYSKGEFEYNDDTLKEISLESWKIDK